MSATIITEQTVQHGEATYTITLTWARDEQDRWSRARVTRDGKRYTSRKYPREIDIYGPDPEGLIASARREIAANADAWLARDAARAAARAPHFYAIAHTYGATMCDGDGDPIGDIYAFDSAAERDEWVADRPTDYISERGYREALTGRLARWAKPRAVRLTRRCRDCGRFSPAMHHLGGNFRPDDDHQYGGTWTPEYDLCDACLMRED